MYFFYWLTDNVFWFMGFLREVFAGRTGNPELPENNTCG